MARLIDGDALLETIEDHVTTVSCCPTVDWSMGKTQMKKQVIEDIRNAPTISGWVSVKDGLPKPEENVLIYTKTGCIKYAQYHEEPKVLNPWYVYEDQARAWTNVISHWMPLPEPPKEVNNG